MFLSGYGLYLERLSIYDDAGGTDDMAGILRAAIRHPGQFIGVFNSRNIKLFFRMSRQNGVRRTMSDMMPSPASRPGS